MGFGACGVGPSGFLGLGCLYKHKRRTLGKNGALRAETLMQAKWIKLDLEMELVMTDQNDQYDESSCLILEQG